MNKYEKRAVSILESLVDEDIESDPALVAQVWATLAVAHAIQANAETEEDER